MRRLLPAPPADLDDPGSLAAVYRDSRRQRHDGRPWLLLNMIATIDGASVLAGASGDLGGPGDRAVFSAVRQLADVVLVGASTVRAERYGPPRKPGQRVAVVTRSGDLDWSTDLFTSGAGLAVMPEDGPSVPVPTIRAGHGGVDLTSVLGQLDAGIVLAEGGPTLNGQLAAAGLIDELCVTVSPLLAGGAARRIITGVDVTGTDGAGNDVAGSRPAHLPAPLELVHVLEQDGFLFCRYLRAPAGAAEPLDT